MRSLETNSPLADFDIISFSLQYEQDYFNVLEILRNADIPLRREDRTSEHPLIIAGGPCASSNPLPLSDFIDVFGKGEKEKEGQEKIVNGRDVNRKMRKQLVALACDQRKSRFLHIVKHIAKQTEIEIGRGKGLIAQTRDQCNHRAADQGKADHTTPQPEVAHADLLQ